MVLVPGLMLAQAPRIDPTPDPAPLYRQATTLGRGETLANERPPLSLGDVLHSVTNQYPPLLAAYLERDLTSRRVQSALGVFDTQLFVRGEMRPSGYYDGSVFDAGVEQFLGLGGATLFGGYRLSQDTLPDYNKDRTQSGGEGRVGLRLPLLRDGSIDRRRASLLKARLDAEIADPFIQRQQLTFVRSATYAYANWIATGLRWRAADELLRVARERMSFLRQQVDSGLLPRIVLTDNERILLSRELAYVQARRRFEAAALVLSLFHRDDNDEPIIHSIAQVPPASPLSMPPEFPTLERHIAEAGIRRPEIRRLDLELEKLGIDLRLARNQRLPGLDASVVGRQPLGASVYKDRDETELLVGVDFRLPVQQREARGRIGEVRTQQERLMLNRDFQYDQIANEINDAHSAWNAAYRQLEQADLNVRLARELQDAETTRFEQGATDLLALQIREQATLEALLLQADAQNDGLRALADYMAAAARGLLDLESSR